MRERLGLLPHALVGLLEGCGRIFIERVGYEPSLGQIGTSRIRRAQLGQPFSTDALFALMWVTTTS